MYLVRFLWLMVDGCWERITERSIGFEDQSAYSNKEEEMCTSLYQLLYCWNRRGGQNIDCSSHCQIINVSKLRTKLLPFKNQIINWISPIPIMKNWLISFKRFNFRYFIIIFEKFCRLSFIVYMLQNLLFINFFDSLIFLYGWKIYLGFGGYLFNILYCIKLFFRSMNIINM